MKHTVSAKEHLAHLNAAANVAAYERGFNAAFNVIETPYTSLGAERDRLRAALSNLTLESLHYMEHGFGKTHLRDSITRAEAALSETKA